MNYKDLARTFEILASKDPNGLVNDWAEHDEYGFDLSRIDLSPSEIRELIEIGWGLGSGYAYDEEIIEVWENPTKHTDEEIMAAYNEYKGIYKFA